MMRTIVRAESMVQTGEAINPDALCVGQYIMYRKDPLCGTAHRTRGDWIEEEEEEEEEDVMGCDTGGGRGRCISIL
jgi:hypothetical protein